MNYTSAAYPLTKLLSDQACKTPDNTALVFGSAHYTYQQLDDLSNRFAHYLLYHHQVMPEDRIGIELQRTEWMVIAMLGIIKTGAAYVPIDPTTPESRKAFIREDAGIRISVTASLLEQFQSQRSSCPHTCPDVQIRPEQLLYVIYTSGTTGQPKGVLIEHRNLVRLFFPETGGFDFHERDVWSLFHNYQFDVSVWEIYGALLFGGKLVVIPKEMAMDTYLFARELIQQGVTILCQTPSAFYNLSDTFQTFPTLPSHSIRYTFIAGEALQPTQLHWWHTHFPETRLFNSYGPTETTIYATFKEIRNKEISEGISNIGRPHADTPCYVLDPQLKPCATGQPGELCIGGKGVARGYLNRPELTIEKFVTIPTLKGERFYRTGDLVRWTSDGDLEYLGRVDDQVKIRGYRIEPGEIEQNLIRLPGVRQAIVLARSWQGSDPELVAYFTGEASPKELRKELSQLLPAYMIPAYYVQVHEWPQTPNGKVDRKALPDPSASYTVPTDYAAPEKDLHIKLAEIWSSILGTTPGQTGIHTSFTELGGNSIKGIRITGQIYRKMGIRLSLPDLLTHPTIEQLARCIESKQDAPFQPIPPAPEQEEYPLSHTQKRFWILSQLETSNRAYIVPWIVSIKGPFDAAAAEKAFLTIIERHEAWRSVFRKDRQDWPVQLFIDPHHPGFHWKRLDHTQHSEQEQEDALNHCLEASLNTPFDLEQGPLLRNILIQRSTTDHIWLLAIHHILTDGWSMGLFMQTWTRLYQEQMEATATSLPTPVIAYRDYAHWQNSPDFSALIAPQKQYWLQQFAGQDIPRLDLSQGKKRPAFKSYNGNQVRVRFDAALTKSLRSFSAQHDVTLFMTLQTAVQALLRYYTRQDDIVLGTPANARSHPDAQPMMGACINTLPLRVRCAHNQTVLDLLQVVRNTTLEAFANMDFPFDELIAELRLPPDPSRHPLFDVMIILQNTLEQIQEWHWQDTRLSVLPAPSNKTAKFDLLFEFIEKNDELEGTLEYDSDLYDPAFIEMLCRHLRHMLILLTQKPNTALQHIDLLDAADKETLLHQLNPAPVYYPTDKTFLDHFRQQVSKHPNREAVVFEDIRLTYLELDQLSSQLAHLLIREHTPAPDQLIALRLQRSHWMVVAILGVLKTGAAYLPIDTQLPEQRLEFILHDSQALTCIDTAWIRRFEDLRAELPVHPPAIVIQPDHLIYCLYTSGSTGLPKGVLMEHRALSDRLYNMWIENDFGENEVILQYASYTFDVSVSEILMPLAWGAKLVGCPSETLYSPMQLLSLIERENITSLHFVPSVLQELLHFMKSREEYSRKQIASIRRILAAGEELPTHLVSNWYRFTCIPLINNYGPTETYYISRYLTQKEDDLIPIGKPISNAGFFILNEEQQLVPTGMPGEICLGGSSLARGYLNRPELTTQKFIPHPFQKGQRIYRSGDLGRWLPDGNIQYLGRMDDQIKLNGMRIELGEINALSNRLPGIQQAVVFDQKLSDNQTTLVLYVMGSLSDQDIKQALAEKLPAYMVPSYIVRMDHFPLTPNGKLNKKQFPLPHTDRQTDTSIQLPETPLEKQLQVLFGNVLQQDPARISVTGDFFSIGGNSIRAIRLIGAIQRDIASGITIRELFTHSTIRKLAHWLSRSTEQKRPSIPKLPVQDYYPVAPVQKGIWLLSSIPDSAQAYANPMAYELLGDIDPEKLDLALTAIVSRHEALRTAFYMNDEGLICQRILPVSAIQIETTIHPSTSKEEEEKIIATFFAHSFDLEKPPFFRSELIQRSDGTTLWLLNLHHLVTDGWSVGLFFEELHAFYQESCFQKPANLPILTIQYTDWACWYDQQLRAGKYDEQRSYWKLRFEGELPVLDLLMERPRPLQRSYKGAVVSALIPQDLTDQLMNFARDHQGTMFMVLYTAVHTLLHRYSGQEDIIIGTPVAGRHHPDIEHLQGLFINTLALRNPIRSTDTLQAVFQSIRQQTLQDFAQADLPFEEVVQSLQLPRSGSRNPLFDVMVVWQNASDQLQELHIGETTIRLRDDLHPATAKFDLSFDFSEATDGIRLLLEYDTELYDEAFAEQLIRHLLPILKTFHKQPSKKIRDINILSESDINEQLFQFNTPIEYKRESFCFPERFALQVQQHPEHTALRTDDGTFTYRQLDQLSNQIAQKLIKEVDPKAGSIIALQLERSHWMIATMLGILKTGAAYLPIDPQHPESRKQFMLEDSSALICVDQHWIKSFQLAADTWTDLTPDVRIQPDSRCYCLYTSGSTGQPKAVSVLHSNLNGLLEAAEQTFLEKDTDITFIATTNYIFDISILELLGALAMGYTIRLLPGFDPVTVLAAVKESDPCILQTTPSLFRTWMAAVPQPEKLPVHTVLIGGEPMDPFIFDYLKNKLPQARTFNGYGPTECTIYASCLPIRESASVSIGKPLPGFIIDILDADLNLVPAGMPGEICISGVGVAEGYLNRPELTAEKFRMHPLRPGIRMYRTGDRGRWRQDGMLEMLGRIDDQIKINGLRIEPGEIEQVLRKTESVLDVKVMPVQIQHEWRLTAYVAGNVNVTKLTEYAAAHLPGYMVPTHFVVMDSLPKTANGKVDKKSLPLPASVAANNTLQIRPVTPVEKKLTAIWAQVLQKNETAISIDDDFFDLGGNSLKAIQIMGLVNQQIDSSIVFKNIWAARTIRAFARLLATETNAHIIRFSTSDQPRHIFFIPPVTGIPNGLEQFFDELKGYNCWGFIYTRDVDFIDYCITNIMERTRDAEHISLIGHSIGGNIAHVLAYELEKKGRKIDRIIMFDSYANDQFFANKKSNYDQKIQESMLLREHRSLNKLIRKNMQLSAIVSHYTKYGYQMQQVGQIQADICLIRTRAGLLQPELFEWENRTNGRYIIRKGYGPHDSMLGHPYMKENIRLLHTIYQSYPHVPERFQDQRFLLKTQHTILHSALIRHLRSSLTSISSRFFRQPSNT